MASCYQIDFLVNNWFFGGLQSTHQFPNDLPTDQVVVSQVAPDQLADWMICVLVSLLTNEFL